MYFTDRGMVICTPLHSSMTQQSLHALMRISKKGRPSLSDQQLDDIVADFKNRKRKENWHFEIENYKINILLLFYTNFPKLPFLPLKIPNLRG